jgi:hypothetical protein
VTVEVLDKKRTTEPIYIQNEQAHVWIGPTEDRYGAVPRRVPLSSSQFDWISEESPCDFVIHSEGFTKLIFGQVKAGLAQHGLAWWRRDFESLPAELSDLEAAIRKSRYLLELPDNWDDEGSPKIREDTWRRVADFLLENARGLSAVRPVSLEAPVITPGPDGSIDILWSDERRQLLINVPAAPEESIEFFGDDRGHTVVKGTVEPSTSALWLFEWLTR